MSSCCPPVNAILPWCLRPARRKRRTTRPPQAWRAPHSRERKHAMIASELIGAPPMVTVTDLRQYTYCPRVVYYMGMLPRPLTGKMREGHKAHEDEEDRERRRSLRPYHLKGGERRYGVRLEDRALGLRAMLDMLVITADEVIPIEHKLSEGPLAATHRVQLTAYALLASAEYGL